MKTIKRRYLKTIYFIFLRIKNRKQFWLLNTFSIFFFEKNEKIILKNSFQT